jgi:hypothetical protein
MDDLGVVEPLRLPVGVERVRRAFLELPWIARVFLALTVADVVARTLGLIAPPVALGDPSAILVSYLPRDALILLPAIVLIRRPTAGWEMPTMVRGAVAVALVTLVAHPTVAFLADNVFDDAPTSALGPASIEAALVAASWLALAWGLRSLNPAEPTPFAAGLANLTAAAIILAAVIQFATALAIEAGSVVPDFQITIWIAIIGGLGLIAVAYLTREIIRGLDDPGRPVAATRLAAGAAVLSALTALLTAAAGVVGLVAQRLLFDQTVYVTISVTSEMALTLVVAAFALGLADPTRPTPAAWEAAARG